MTDEQLLETIQTIRSALIAMSQAIDALREMVANVDERLAVVEQA